VTLPELTLPCCFQHAWQSQRAPKRLHSIVPQRGQRSVGVRPDGGGSGRRGCDVAASSGMAPYSAPAGGSGT